MKINDLTGKRYGKLMVIRQDYSHKKGSIYWLCKCDCGNLCSVRSGNLQSGNTVSCGCYHKQRLRESTEKFNEYNLDGERGIGYTSKGEEFYFDLEDYDRIKDYCWCKSAQGYIVARMKPSNKLIRLHRLVLNCLDSNFDVDHIDGNPLNNCKDNLRQCTHADNMKNQGLRSNNTSGITGVHWDKKRKKWKAALKLNGKTVFFKRFNSKEEAIKARKEAECFYFGEYAR